MNAWKTTSIYLIGAGLLAGAAFFLTWTPAQTEAYKDIGEEFYPGFTDPLAAKSIEVVSWDEAKAARVPFKVQYRDGRWRIPSHFDYPADAEDNLKKVATQYIGVKKDDVRSDLPADHEKFGVVDPLDESVSGNAGRGKRVTFRDLAGNMLADLIIGKAVEGKSGYFYVRLPGKPRVYASKIDAKVSAEFKDWVETDLLKLTSSDIQTLKFNNYSHDELRQALGGAETLTLRKENADWKVDGGIGADEEILRDKISALTTTLDNLRLAGVHPKHPSIVEILTKDPAMKQTPDAADITKSPLAAPLKNLGAGFYRFVTVRDGKQETFILANEGELTIRCKDGVSYVLRHGGVLSSAMAADDSAAQPPVGDQPEKPDDEQKDDRFMIVTVFYDDSADVEPEKPDEPSLPRPGAEEKKEGEQPAEATPPETTLEAAKAWEEYDTKLTEWQKKHDEWKKRVEEAKKKVKDLNDRFANWYYVISSDDFTKLRLTRDKVVRPIPKVDIKTIESGNGPEIKKGQTLHVLYTGWLMNADGSQGKEFDSRQNRDDPYTFEFGSASADDGWQKGWQKGVEGMKIGEKRRLVIPPELGYGEAGSPPDIPPSATLIFEITLLKAEDKESPGDGNE